MQAIGGDRSANFKLYASLSEAISGRKEDGALAIPQVISFKVDENWIPTQLTPIFSIKNNSELTNIYTRKRNVSSRFLWNFNYVLMITNTLSGVVF